MAMKPPTDKRVIGVSTCAGDSEHVRWLVPDHVTHACMRKTKLASATDYSSTCNTLICVWNLSAYACSQPRDGTILVLGNLLRSRKASFTVCRHTLSCACVRWASNVPLRLMSKADFNIEVPMSKFGKLEHFPELTHSLLP
eukprot:1400895-Amphidinium_carterae.1